MTDFGALVKDSASRLNKVTIFGVALLIQLFFFLSANYIWGEKVAAAFEMYFIMLAVSYVLLMVDNPLRYVTLKDGVVQYLAAFVSGLFLFTLLGLGAENTGYGGFGSLSALILAQSVCVGLSEELIFRGALPKAMRVSGFSYFGSRFISVAAFALFHGWAYDWAIGAMFASFCFGAIMQYVWDGSISEDVGRKAGYPLAAVGFHAAWNVVVLSPFAIIAGVA